MAKAAIFLGFSWLAQYGSAKEVHLDWNVTWVNAAPNGHQRPVIGINGEWPCPQIDLDLGDRLIVDLYNGLGNQSTGLHWHGFRQYMTGTMDGASEVTQCPLAPGSKMTYDFMVNQTGSYWYHSHNMGQYPDGLRGPIIVHDPSPPYSFDEEITLTFTEWYNEQMPTLLNMYQSEDSGGKEPLPDSTLINDASDTKIRVQPNKTYLVHLICLGNWPGHTFVFDDHQLTVVEVDGVWTQPYDVTDKKLRITTGQRMSVLIKTKPDASRNYAMWDSTDLNMMFFYEDRDIPSNFNPNATAWLVYDESKELPGPPDIHGLDPNADFVDDVEFVPYDQDELLAPVDRQIVLHTASREIDDVVRFTVNGEPYISPEVPSLYTGMTADNSSDAEIYGQVNPMIVHHNEVVELVINNHHGNLHPWHLHGHQFQVLQRSSVDGGSFLGYFQNISSTPVKRDTIMVQNHGHTVIRFRADNPDKSPTTLKKFSLWIILTFFIRVWLLHCHIEWHVEGGLVATLIEAPEELQKLSIPADHKDICSSYGTPTSGNAAGNTGDDMTGANTDFQPGSAGAITKPKPAANVPSPNYGSGSGSNPSSEPTGQPAPKNPSPEPSNPEPQPTPEPQNDPPSAQDQQWEQPPFATLDEDNFVWLARHKPQIPNNA